MQSGLDAISAQDLRDRGGRDERHRAPKISYLPSPAQLERDSGAPPGTGNSQTSLAGWTWLAAQKDRPRPDKD